MTTNCNIARPLRAASLATAHTVACCTLLLVVTGCNWFAGDQGNAGSDDEAVGDAATVDTGADDHPDSDNLAAAGVPISQRGNPHRQLADPYFIIGESLPEWDVGEWANVSATPLSAPLTLQQLRGKVVVVHFWVDGSDESARTMAAMNDLAKEFRGKPVVMVGIFMAGESISANPWEVAQSLASDWQVTFPIAADEGTHINWWRSRYDHLPSTATFVIGPDGRVVHLHPGPEFFPSDEISERICNEDFHAVRRAISGALSSQLAESNSGH